MAFTLIPRLPRTRRCDFVRDSEFAGSITGDVYAQPLYIEGGPRGRAVVIAVTESNNVYALDAINGTIVWFVNVGPTVPAGTLPCGNVQPVGISGTPVVDLPSRSLFFDAMIMTNSMPKHFIYSLNVDTGSLNHGWPVEVDSNAVSSYGVSTPVRFDSLAQGQRGALTVIGTNLYVPYGGLYGDCSTYHGWIVGMPLTNPTNVVAWATSVNGGGAWSVGGIASDGVSPYLATGNTMGASTWSGGEAIIRFPPDLVLTNNVTNFWTPTNWSTLDSEDNDIGGSGPILVTVPGATPSQLVVALGKDGNAYLLNRANLGGMTNAVTTAHVAGSSIIQAAAAYTTSKGTYVVFANADNLYALRIGATDPPTITNVWRASENGRGSPFVTSTDGTNDVIVWGIGSEDDQRLHAFDGDTGTNIYTGGGTNELMASAPAASTPASSHAAASTWLMIIGSTPSPFPDKPSRPSIRPISPCPSAALFNSPSLTFPARCSMCLAPPTSPRPLPTGRGLARSRKFPPANSNSPAPPSPATRKVFSA